MGSPEAIDGAKALAGLGERLDERDLPAFRERLAAHVAASPRDGRAWAILGRVDLALDRHADAAAAFANAIGASGKVASDPEIWVDYAEAVGMTEGGTLSGRAVPLIAKALAIDPANARALEMAGSLAAERGDPAGAARHWKLALGQLEAGDPRRDGLARAIASAERMALPGGMTKP